MTPFQKRFWNSARITLVEACPQNSGKSTAAIEWIKEKCLVELKAGDIAWYAVPLWKQSQTAFERLTASVDKRLIRSINKSMRQVEFVNGVTLKFVTCDNPKGIYSDPVKKMVIDESSDYKDDAWPAMFSRGAETECEYLIIGNRRGRGNEFYRMCRTAEDSGDSNDIILLKMTATNAVEEGLMSQTEYDFQKSINSEIKFRELFELEDTDALNPFLGYQRCVGSPKENPQPSDARTYCVGIDPARIADNYAVIGIDEGGHWTFQESWSGLSAQESVRKTVYLLDQESERNALIGIDLDDKKAVEAALKAKQNVPVLFDNTGIGVVYSDLLAAAGVDAIPYNFTQRTRQELLENLAIGISQNQVRFPQIVADQLARFEYVQSGIATKYAAPDSVKDDEVMAFALAYWELTRRPTFRFF